MAENSAIEWTHHTFNPWIGCTKVSPACDNCYAEAFVRNRMGKPELWQGKRQLTSPANWNLPKRWNRKAEKLGIRYRVFCASLADVFDNQVPASWREDLWRVVEQTPHLDWLLLTKRIGNAGNMLPVPFDFDRLYPNVWIGATVANQTEANRDIPKLLEVPARVRFLSCEPLLGPIEFSDVSHRSDAVQMLGKPALHGVHWVIAGGESGPGARPSRIEWYRSLRDQCAAAGVPFLFKQWGEYAPDDPAANRTSMRRVGKKAAGRLLDGALHDGYPVLERAVSAPGGD